MIFVIFKAQPSMLSRLRSIPLRRVVILGSLPINKIYFHKEGDAEVSEIVSGWQQMPVWKRPWSFVAYTYVRSNGDRWARSAQGMEALRLAREIRQDIKDGEFTGCEAYGYGARGLPAVYLALWK